MNTAEQFARIAALRPARRKEVAAARIEESVEEIGGDRLAELLGARINRNHFGEHLSLREWFATPQIFSPDARSLSLLLPPLANSAADAAADRLNAALNPEQWLFLDTETTGLAGGTGTYAFMVGIAWWDAGGLQVEQFFMRDLNEEHSLLLELHERMKERPVLVTFNGKSFDWPLLDTRFRMTRSFHGFAPKLHLDLLHPARQLWKMRIGSVRLRDLERQVLSENGRALDWTRHDDINSSLIPQMYFDYLRHGIAEPLVGIFRHNQMDLRGLAALAGKILTLLDSANGIAEAANADSHHPIEVLGLSRLMRKRGHGARARELYETALRFGLPRSIERLAQLELAQMAKRELDYTRAVSLWDALREPGGPTNRSQESLLAEDAQKALESAIAAAEQLAIYYEHRAKESRRALDLVRAALAELRQAACGGTRSSARAAATEARLERRLARLERRCGDAPIDVPLLESARHARRSPGKPRAARR